MTSSMDKKKKCTHTWKYYGNAVRICESPFEFLVKGCGKVETKGKDYD